MAEWIVTLFINGTLSVVFSMILISFVIFYRGIKASVQPKEEPKDQHQRIEPYVT